MATQRRQPQPGEVETVDPNVDTGPTDGLSTMDGLFKPAMVLDEVQEVPLQHDPGEPSFVIRTNSDVEDMTVGFTDNHFAFKAGTRYRVPFRVAQILYNRNKLMEQPFPYDEVLQRR